MSRKILMSSDFTKLMATPLRPNRPERPILKEERSCMCIQLWVKVWWKVNLTLWLLRVTSISFLPYHTTHESQTKVKRRGRNPQLKKLLIIRKMQREQNGEFKYWFPDAKDCEELHRLPVNVQFTIVWQVVVDNQRHLLHIYASSPHICWDQHSTAWNKQREDVRVKHFTSWRKNITFEKATHNFSLPLSRSKFFHDGISFFLWHITMHSWNSEVCLSHFLHKPVHLIRKENDFLRISQINITWFANQKKNCIQIFGDTAVN